MCKIVSTGVFRTLGFDSTALFRIQPGKKHQQKHRGFITSPANRCPHQVQNKKKQAILPTPTEQKKQFQGQVFSFWTFVYIHINTLHMYT